MMPKKVTIRDIAKLANVSPATVSGVLNNSGRQTPSTVNHVHRVMEEVGYVPRRNKLRTENKRSRVKVQEIGLLFPDPDRESANTDLTKKLNQGIEKVLSEKGICLRALFTNENGQVDKKDIKALRGMIVRGPFDKGPVDLNFKFPVITVFDASTSQAQVSIDNVNCASWLGQQAHKAKAQKCLSLQSSDAYNLPLKIRHTTFEDSIEQQGASCESSDIEKFNFTKLTDFDFIFCGGHDKEVFKLLDYCLDHKLNDLHLAIVTTKEIDLTKYACLNLHWVNIDPEQVGIASAKLLLQKIADKVEINGRLLIAPKIHSNRSF
jgi:DNA-binding LacI/PurR family transcriptional regulator